MTSGPEAVERRARAVLNEAVEAYAHAAGWADGWVMAGWALVADQRAYDDDGHSRSAHAMCFRDGSMPTAQALGLFMLAADTVRAGVFPHEPPGED